MGDIQPITELLEGIRRGDTDATDRLFSVVYEDLRRVAHRQLSARGSGLTLNTETLVHETYLKLFDRGRISPEDRRHFFATAARAMRQIIVDHARKTLAQKRGGDARRVSTGDAAELLDAEHGSFADHLAEVLDVDRALNRLASVSTRLVRVVELRFFAGLTVEQVAELLDVSPRTVKSEWQAARAVLYRELRDVKDD